MNTSGRLIILLLILVLCVLAGVVVGWLSLPLILVGVGLGLALAADLVKDFYNNSLRESLRHHGNLLIGWARTVIVDDGKTLVPEPPRNRSPIFYGPRRLVVKPENAVLTTLRNNEHRLYGPGSHPLAPLEEIKHLFDLRIRYKSFVIDDVLTRDRMLAAVRVNVTYSPAVMYGHDPRPVSLEQDDPDGQALTFLMGANWDQATRASVEGAVRRRAQTLPLEQLLALETGTSTRIEEDITKLAQETVHPRGIRVERVDIESIAPKAQGFVVPDTGWEDRAHADALRTALELLLKANDDALAKGVTREARRQMALQGMLTELRKKPEYRAVFTDLMNRRLMDLQ